MAGKSGVSNKMLWGCVWDGVGWIESDIWLVLKVMMQRSKLCRCCFCLDGWLAVSCRVLASLGNNWCYNLEQTFFGHIWGVQSTRVGFLSMHATIPENIHRPYTLPNRTLASAKPSSSIEHLWTAFLTASYTAFQLPQHKSWTATCSISGLIIFNGISLICKKGEWLQKVVFAVIFVFVQFSMKSTVDESPTTWKTTIDIGSADELHLKVVKRTTFLLFYALLSPMGLFLRGGLLWNWKSRCLRKTRGHIHF